MKASWYKQAVFFIKSALWSLLFYIVLMLAINWDDVSSKITGKNTVTTVTRQNNTPQCGGDDAPVKISSGADAIYIIKSFFQIAGRL